MKRKFSALILVATLIMTMLVGCGNSSSPDSKGTSDSPSPATSSDGAPITIRLSATMGTNHQLTMSAEEFAKYVNENSGGAINVEVYPSAQLYNDENMTEAIPEGFVEMGLCQTANWAGYVPSAEYFTLSGYFDDYDWFKRCCAGEPGQYVIKDVEDTMGVKILSLFNYGICEMVSTKELKTPEDFQGTKMRMLGISEGLYCQALGGAPVSISAAENYEGLQKGTIDGVSTGPSSVISRKLYEVAPYVTLNTMLKETKYFLMVNGDFWNSLSAENQALLQEAADYAYEYNVTASAKSDADAVAALEAMDNVTVDYWTPEQQKAIQDVVLPVVLENFKGMVGDETYNFLMDASEALR